jgi:glycosyltransferase involved in cell wall biosynthesis
VSDFNLQYLRETHAESASRVRRIYNGMDLSGRQYVSPVEREPLVLGIGRLVEKKGFDDLIRACDLLKKSGFAFQCQIVGTGEDQPKLRRLIDELDIEDRVELCGPRPQREVFELIQRAAVFAAPCVVGQDGNRDGLPTVLLEAMSLGTPCVSTDVTGIPEVVQHNRTGLIVGQRNTSELASAIRRLIEDSRLRQRLASAARQLIEAEFDITQTTAQQRELFQSCHSTRHESSNIEAMEVM